MKPNDKKLKDACEIVERHCRAIGKDCQVIFTTDLWFKKQVGEVEAAGWARVSGSSIVCQKSLTDAQATTLAKRGLEIPEWMMGHI